MPKPSPVPLARSSSRSAFIDHIRIVLTGLVIAHHAAIAYGGSGSWYWREQADSSNLWLVGFNALNQSYFMGFFFLLAGYYTPASLERKGARRFLADRLLRLGIPLLFYFFILSPTTHALVELAHGKSFWSAWLEAAQFGRFEPGPLWFAEALLLFALGYLAWTRIRPAATSSLPRPFPRARTLLGAALALGLVSFAVRQFMPVGESIAWLQIGYFPCYVFLFAVGCATSRSQLLEKISFAEARPLILVSAAALLTLPFVLVTRLEDGSFLGGWTLNAFYYALWDPLVAWGILLAALWAARAYWNRSSRATRWLSRRAYGAYILHPPALVGASLFLAQFAANAPPIARFFAATALAIALSFLATSALLALPGARRIL